MSKSTRPQIGDRVLHHGAFHTIKLFNKRATMVDGEPVAVELLAFRNAPFTVGARVDDLRWSDRYEAWYLPGRVLCRNERALAACVFGSWPKASTHLAVLPLLDAVDLDEVDFGSFVSAIKQHKQDVATEVKRLQDEDASPEEIEKYCVQYAKAAIAQIERLRANREEAL